MKEDLHLQLKKLREVRFVPLCCMSASMPNKHHFALQENFLVAAGVSDLRSQSDGRDVLSVAHILCSRYLKMSALKKRPWCHLSYLHCLICICSFLSSFLGNIVPSVFSAN